MNKIVASISLGTAVCITASAFAQDSHLSLTRQSVASMHEIAAALDKVTDEPGAAAAVETVKKVHKKLLDIGKRQLELPGATLQEQAQVSAQMTEAQKISGELIKSLSRLKKEGLLTPDLQKALADLQSVQKELAQASRSIAEGDLSSPDLPVKSSDEVGRLTGTFNQMKHAMAQQLTTQQALHREEVRNLALEKDLEHTRLEVLKSQVNPHFLFNTLNMISCMARLEDAATTDQMIVHLGSLFRHNLRTKRQQITLEEELDGLEDYIYLQQMRFDGRITVEKSIRVQPAAVLVPSFMLQPVVENAYSHGLKSCEEGGRILLRAWMQGKVLVLTVADNGKGMTPEELDAVQTKIAQSEQTGRSIGLGNISRRIGMLYPGGKMQVYSRADCGTVVRFELPQTQQPEEKEETLS